MSEETKLGRPTAFREEYIAQAEKLCTLGATDADLADFFEVGLRTIARWATANIAFRQALKAGKEVADTRVERSLYQRAVGYSFASEKVFQHRGQIIRAETVEHVPPDVVAQIFWLKNRRPDLWRDRHEHLIGPVRVADDDLDDQIAAVARRIGIEASVPGAAAGEGPPGGPAQAADVPAIPEAAGVSLPWSDQE